MKCTHTNIFQQPKEICNFIQKYLEEGENIKIIIIKQLLYTNVINNFFLKIQVQ